MINVTMALLCVIWRKASALGRPELSTALISVTPNISASDRGKAVRKPMQMVRFLAGQGLHPQYGRCSCLHDLWYILSRPGDLLCNVDSAVSATVGIPNPTVSLGDLSSQV